MAEREAASPLKWHVRLGQDQPVKVAVIFAVATLSAALGLLLFKGIWPGLLGFAIIAGSTTEFWLGSRYEVNAEGVTSRTGLSVTKIGWGDVKRIIVDDAGVKVTPLAEDSRLSPFRGVYVRYGSLGREAVVSAMRSFGGSDVFVDG